MRKRTMGKRTRRSVDDQIIQTTPSHVGQKLADHRVFLGSPPDDRVLPLLEEKADAHAPEPARGPIRVDRDPALAALVDRVPVKPKHPRDGWPRKVDVQEPDTRCGRGRVER